MNKLWQQLAIATNWPVLVAAGVLSALGMISIWAYDPVDGTRQVFFLCVAVAWQIAFLVIATDPIRYRPMMPVALLTMMPPRGPGGMGIQITPAPSVL